MTPFSTLEHKNAFAVLRGLGNKGSDTVSEFGNPAKAIDDARVKSYMREVSPIIGGLMHIVELFSLHHIVIASALNGQAGIEFGPSRTYDYTFACRAPQFSCSWEEAEVAWSDRYRSQAAAAVVLEHC